MSRSVSIVSIKYMLVIMILCHVCDTVYEHEMIAVIWNLSSFDKIIGLLRNKEQLSFIKVKTKNYNNNTYFKLDGIRSYRENALSISGITVRLEQGQDDHNWHERVKFSSGERPRLNNVRAKSYVDVSCQLKERVSYCPWT